MVKKMSAKKRNVIEKLSFGAAKGGSWAFRKINPKPVFSGMKVKKRK